MAPNIPGGWLVETKEVPEMNIPAMSCGLQRVGISEMHWIFTLTLDLSKERATCVELVYDNITGSLYIVHWASDLQN